MRLGYRIVELFSDGLYSSPNKAIEELVSNSFDAGAKNVHVVLSSDRRDPNALILVIDDGISMDNAGLRQHWIIGESNKRYSEYRPPMGRKQIGKFGIGKLATFVLANHFTHICKRDGTYYAVTMDYTLVGERSSGAPVEPVEQQQERSSGAEQQEHSSGASGRGGLAEQQEIGLPLRELTEEEARKCLPDLANGTRPGYQAIRLFGEGSASTWTVAILSNLKDKAAQIKMGQLEWVLRTAMPLRDDFKLYLNGDKLKPSKFDIPLLERWTLGKEIVSLPRPAPDDLEVSTDNKAEKAKRHGLVHPSLGRITGYVEAYKEPLTGGKSSLIGRSNGFFIYVHGRLVNIDDERFGIDPDTLRHGTFTRFRAVLHIDRLDEELRSTREAVREGELATAARNIAHALFNVARKALADFDEAQGTGAKTKSKISHTPGSLTRRPLIHLATLALRGRAVPRFLRVPPMLDAQQQESFIESLRSRLEADDASFVADIRHEYLSADAGIAVYDLSSNELIINDLHPFVAMYRDDYEKRETLQLLCIAEVLTEAYLYGAEVSDSAVKEVLSARDELLRRFAKSQRRTAPVIAKMLEDAAHDKHLLEREVVAAFDSLGFDAVLLGGSGKPDGMATAILSAGDSGARRYKVSLEAKSKEKDEAKVSARAVNVSGVARHREMYECDHAVVVGPEFQLEKKGEGSAVVTEIRENIAQTKKTITLIRIHDLARLVRLQPLKGLGLDVIRELFQTCVTPDEVRAWIEKLDSNRPQKTPFRTILDAIWALQGEQPDEPVELAAVRVILRRDHKLDIPKKELLEAIAAMTRIAPTYVMLRDEKVELTQKPERIIKGAGAALQEFPGDEAKRSIFKL